MRAVVMRVHSASVSIDGQIAGQIDKGFLVLLGVGAQDTEADARYLAGRICKLRVFEDTSGKMNIAPADAQASLLVISNFTLYGDCAPSRRPSFSRAAPPAMAISLYELFLETCRATGLPVASGIFGADMQVASVNDGPVTLILDTQEMHS